MHIIPHTIASLGAGLCLVLAATFGDVWIAAALIWVLAFSWGFGVLGGDRGGANSGRAGWLPVLLGLAHVPLLYLCIWALAANSYSVLASVALFLAAGLYLGQVSNPAGHELIHRTNAAAFRLGQLVFTTILFGHHTSAHRLVHHVHVATAADPNSARRGQSLWRFLPQAWIGSYRSGLIAERRLRPGRTTPYPQYVLGAAVAVMISFLLAGIAGVAVHLFLAAYATLQLLTSDYVQHYGLTRRIQPDGRPETFGPAHSWDAAPTLPRWLMLNAPAHAAHHLRPHLGFEQLSDTSGAPQLPRSLAVMGFVAVFPAWWRHVMDPRLDEIPGRYDRS